MRNDWIRLFQIAVIGTAVWCGALASFAFAEEEAQENAKQQIYLSQMAKYPVLSEEFRGVIEENVQPRTVPSEGKDIFLWQLEEYKELNTEFADTFAQNVEPRPVPETPAEIYLWQLEEYKELDKEFYHEHRREF